LPRLREVVYARSLPLATSHLQVVASVAGVDAAILGAGMMVSQHVLSPAVVEAAVQSLPG